MKKIMLLLYAVSSAIILFFAGWSEYEESPEY